MSGVAPTRTVVVWCADWPAAALGRPPEAPVVVLHANRVVSVSPPAREAGVEIGARRREAQRADQGIQRVRATRHPRTSP